MVKYIEFGNIFKLNGVSNYAHGCNCVGAMGKGIALQFKERFPKMYTEYRSLCKEGKFNLGDVFTYNYENGHIFNLGTQVNWKTKADTYAIEESLAKTLQFATKENIRKIALPRIGAGLGGLNWADVKNIIDKISNEYPIIELFIVENYRE